MIYLMKFLRWEFGVLQQEGNEITRERHKHELPPISGEETWNLLKECGCDPNSLPKIYRVVMKDVDILRMIDSSVSTQSTQSSDNGNCLWLF